MGTAARFCCLCGKPEDEVGPLSARGRCQSCAILAMKQNVEQIHAHRGPYFNRWRSRIVAAFGGVLPDEQ